MVSFLVVAAPHLIPCPVDPRTLADSPDPTGATRRRRRRKISEEEAGSDAMSDERRRRLQMEGRIAPKRECPVPKPGGLIGQVLGWKDEQGSQAEERVTLTQRVERAICRPKSRSKDDDQ